ncbi:MAG: Ig-like domain-containing protein [Planctomycetota bacterium]|jgi:hypothetical protein
MFNQKFALTSTGILTLLFLAACSGGGGGGSSVMLPPGSGGGGGGGGGTNNAPVINSTPATTATVGLQYTYMASATDADGDPISWNLLVAPTGMSVTTLGIVNWTPNASQVGSHNVSLQAFDGTDDTVQSWTITVSTAGSGGGLPTSVSLTDLGALPNGMKVLSDMVEFDGKLYIAAAQDPLNSPFGAGVYYFDGSNVQTSFYDAGSQGFLRTKVYNNKLYIPDGDPNGMTDGTVYIYSTGSSTPLSTVVTGGVHNFDVVEYNSNLYVSGSDTSGASTLHMFNSSNSTWELASTGSFGRLKYLAVLDGEIWCSKQLQSGVDGVTVDTTMAQSGFTVSAGGSLLPCMENIDGHIYTAVWTSTGAVNNMILKTGIKTSGQPTDISGINGVMWDVIKHTDGYFYAIAADSANEYIYGSTDGENFTELYRSTVSRFGTSSTSNADGRPSIASFNGKLYAGSSTNGHLYRID